MKQLIVNADDFGASEKRNLGIIESHRRGIVTAASLLANGAAFDHAVKLARETPSLDIGLHLNLSDGRPLLEDHRSLVDEIGCFLGKQQARTRAPGFDAGEIERETKAQLGKLHDMGLKVTHLDGHQHIQIYIGSIAHVMRSHGVRWLRCPWDNLAERLEGRVLVYCAAALMLRGVAQLGELRVCDSFGGIELSESFSREALERLIRRLRGGSTELMVHPGYADGPDGFSGPDRERELEALTDPHVKEVLREEGIELTTFAKLA